MPDNTDTVDQPVIAPERPVLPPGSGYTYSSQGPGDFSSTRMVGGPGGVQVPIPQNARNYAFVQGAPGGQSSPATQADPQTEMLRAVFNKLPVDQAIKAVQAAHQYQGQRLYQRLLSEGKSASEALAAAGPLLFGGGINPTELAKFAQAVNPKPPQMTPYQQAEIGIREKELAQRAAAERLRASERMGRRQKEGTMTQQQVHEFQMLSADKAHLQKALETGNLDAEKSKSVQAKLEEIHDRQAELIGKPAKSKSTQRVRVKDKKGKMFTVPSDQLDAALKQGYEKAQ